MSASHNPGGPDYDWGIKVYALSFLLVTKLNRSILVIVYMLEYSEDYLVGRL